MSNFFNGVWHTLIWRIFFKTFFDGEFDSFSFPDFFSRLSSIENLTRFHFPKFFQGFLLLENLARFHSQSPKSQKLKPLNFQERNLTPCLFAIFSALSKTLVRVCFAPSILTRYFFAIFCLSFEVFESFLYLTLTWFHFHELLRRFWSKSTDFTKPRRRTKLLSHWPVLKSARLQWTNQRTLLLNRSKDQVKLSSHNLSKFYEIIFNFRKPLRKRKTKLLRPKKWFVSELLNFHKIMD